MRVLPLIILGILPLLSACSTVESERPLSPPRLAVRDPRLEGLWRARGKDLTMYTYIAYGPKGEGSMVDFGKDDTGAMSMSADFFVTRTGKHEYLNLSNRLGSAHGHAHTDHPGTYTFTEVRFTWLGRLVITSVDGAGFAKAVKEGRLRGRVIEDKKGNATDTLLKDSGERILGFIEGAKPEDVLGTPVKFSRIGN